jgi:hypothetical protein
MSGISSSTRNAARLRDYDRVVQLARLRMNSLLTDPRAGSGEGSFDPAITGGLECGWRAQVSVAEKMPSAAAGDYVLDHVQLEIWWTSGGQHRTFPLESYRRRTLRPQDLGGAP